jgi:hypothetical protein
MTGDRCSLSPSATDLEEKRREVIKEWIKSGRIKA